METKQKHTLFKAAGILMLTMIVSRILGFVRDIFVYGKFGQNFVTDAYNASFTIPDFIYLVLVGGGLSSAFIPVFSSYIARNEADEGWKVASIVFNWIIVFLIILITVCYIFTPQLVDLIIKHADTVTKEMTVNLTRIMFVQVIFLTFSGVSMGILNSFKRFTAPAVGSMLYNLGIILGGLLLAAPIEMLFPGYGIAGFSVGVVIGAALYFFVQVPDLKRVGLKYYFSFDFHHPGVKHLILLLIPVLIGLSASEINIIITQRLASSLSDGMLSALRTGQRIMQLPVGVFAIAIAVAVFPTLTAYMARNEVSEFKSAVSLGLRSVIFVTLPAAVGLAILRTPIIRVMFEFKGSAFTSASTAATAQALLFFCIGLVAYSAIHVLSRTFYAMHDTTTPVIAAVISIGVNIGCGLLLLQPMEQGGLALAYSLAGIFNMALLLFLYKRRMGNIGGRLMVPSFIKMGLAALVMGLAVLLTYFVCESALDMTNKWLQIIELLLSIGVGIGVYFIITYLWKMEECRMVVGIFKRKLGRRNKLSEGDKKESNG